MSLKPLAVNAKEIAAAINERDWPGLTARCIYDLAFTDVATSEKFENVQEFIGFLTNWTKIFPDLSVSLVMANSTLSTEILELRFEGTQTGPFPVMDGTIPATDRDVVWQACIIFDLETTNARKIKGARIYYDITTLLDQLAVALDANAEQDKEIRV